MPFQPTDPVKITLQAQQWNSIITVLGEAPYRIAAPLIQEIAAQSRAAEAPPPAEPVAEAAPAQPANGHDKSADAAASG